jgi:hypothetical protein
MDRAIEAARNSDAAEALISGVMLVRTQLFRILQEEGLERVSVLGLPFDRRSAEAVKRRAVTDPDQDGLVIEELQGGHQLRGHIIRRAKVVVGEFNDEAVEPAVAVRAMPEPKPAPPPAPVVAVAPPAPPAPVEPTVAMRALPETPAKAEPGPEPVEARDAEEPIVVEDWNEPTHDGTPASALFGGPPPSAATEEEDESASATMVLGDGAAMFVRPPPPIPATRGATAAAAEPAEATQWENAEPWPRPSAKETQPVPRSGPRPPRPTPAGLGPPRVRTGPVPPIRDRSPVYEDVPTSPAAPAVPPPRTPTNPGLAPPRPAGGGRGMAIGLAVGAAVLLAALLGWWALRRGPKPPEVATTVAEASPVAASPVAAAPRPAPVIPEDVTVVVPSTGETGAPAVPSPGTATPAAAGVTTPGPPSAAAPAAAPPPVAAAAPTARPTPPPPAPPVNPVPALLAQAEQAMTAKRYRDAINKFDEVLKIEPQNAEAANRRLHAQGERASVGRYFLTAVTMSEGKASGGGIKGFDGGSVVKSQCECALTYEVSPANPSQGEPYTVSILLRNDSKKEIKPRTIAVTVTVNGTASSRPVPLLAKEVPRGKTVLVGKLEDTWTVGTTSWSLEAAVTAVNTYRTQLTWELRVPSAQ